jgi:hypothetical protein
MCWSEAAEPGYADVFPVKREEDVNEEQSEATSKHWRREMAARTPMVVGLLVRAEGEEEVNKEQSQATSKQWPCSMGTDTVDFGFLVRGECVNKKWAVWHQIFGLDLAPSTRGGRWQGRGRGCGAVPTAKRHRPFPVGTLSTLSSFQSRSMTCASPERCTVPPFDGGEADWQMSQPKSCFRFCPRPCGALRERSKLRPAPMAAQTSPSNAHQNECQRGILCRRHS